MSKNNIKLYCSIAILILAVITTLDQFLFTIKRLCIYIPYFTILCAPAILVFRNKRNKLYRETRFYSMNRFS